MVVRIRLDQSSAEFVDALAHLINAIDHADQALLEDTVAGAQQRLVRHLQGLALTAEDEVE